MTISCTTAFSPTSIQQRTINDGNIRHRSSIHHNPIHQQSINTKLNHKQTSTSLNILGSDGGILGVGAPEIAVSLLVGYFVLGPSDLYKLVKEIGKFIQNFRTLGAEAATAFEGTMENQLELTELRKAQSELNDAFNFRRSINTSEGSDAFDKSSFSDNVAAAAAESSAAAAVGGVGTAVASDGSTVKVEEGTTIKKKRRLVRRKKKKVVIEPEEEPMEEINVPSESDEYPDLDMLDAVDLTEEERLRAERLDRLTGGGSSSSSDEDDGDDDDEPDWFNASEEDIASAEPETDPALSAFEKNRFQSQLSADDWNKQVMDNEDELSPLSLVMQRLAILEEEKNAADKLIEEEYQKRMDNEDKYYLEKRQVLMDAITDVQTNVYGGGDDEDDDKQKEKGSEEKVLEESGPKFNA